MTDEAPSHGNRGDPAAYHTASTRPRRLGALCSGSRHPDGARGVSTAAFHVFLVRFCKGVLRVFQIQDDLSPS